MVNDGIEQFPGRNTRGRARAVQPPAPPGGHPLPPRPPPAQQPPATAPQQPPATAQQQPPATPQQTGKKRGLPDSDAPSPEDVKKVKANNGAALTIPAPLPQPAGAGTQPARSGATGLRKEWLTKWYKGDFLPGYIIKCPVHETSMDPSPDLSNPRVKESIAQSAIATISSKRRPAIVITSYERNMLVMPMYTRGNRGLDGIYPESFRAEFMGIREDGNMSILHPGYYDRNLRAYMAPGQTLEDTSAVRLTHVSTVDHREDIKIVGALCKDSTEYLIEHWDNYRRHFEAEGWQRERRITGQGAQRHHVVARNYTKFNEWRKPGR